MHSAFYILHCFALIIFYGLRYILKNERMSLGKDEKNVGIYSDDEAIP
jgi:hypothetical protein